MGTRAYVGHSWYSEHPIKGKQEKDHVRRFQTQLLKGYKDKVLVPLILLKDYSSVIFESASVIGNRYALYVTGRWTFLEKKNMLPRETCVPARVPSGQPSRLPATWCQCQFSFLIYSKFGKFWPKKPQKKS